MTQVLSLVLPRVTRHGTLLALLLASPLTLALQPAHEADRLVMAAEEALAAEDYRQAEAHLDQARRLGIELPAEFDFFYGKLLRQQEELNQARNHLERYVDRAGSGGKHYREALSLITQIERQRSGRNDRRQADSNEGTAEIRWANEGGENYLKEIQDLYDRSDARQALTQHINSLLKFYAYGGDARIIAASRQGTPSRHRIHTSDRGEIVSLNRLGGDETQPFTEDRFSVYGIDPYLDYRCAGSSANCWILHPVTSVPWLQIVENEEVAAELTKAFSQLIKQMQKQG